jgi:Fur family ferric uptake transcriptional regulator
MPYPDNLREKGLKATLPRLKILELFEAQGSGHLSAEDVHKLLAETGTDIGLATVYRVLEQFEQAGILMRHRFDGNKACFELNRGEHHDHLLCLDCGAVEEFVDERIENLQQEIATRHGFALDGHELCLYVRCLRPECPNRQKEAAEKQ